MNIVEVQHHLANLLQQSSGKYYSYNVGNLCIATFESRAFIIDKDNRKLQIMINSVITNTKHSVYLIMNSNGSGVCEFGIKCDGIIEIVEDIPKYLAPGTSVDTYTIDLNEMCEEEHFQKMTTMTIPDLYIFEKINKFRSDIIKSNNENSIITLLGTDTDWDNIDLKPSDFIIQE